MIGATGGCEQAHGPPKSAADAAGPIVEDRRDEALGPPAHRLPPDLPRRDEAWQKRQLAEGERAYKSGRPEEALQIYLEAADADTSTPTGQLALFTAGELCMDGGRLSQAESLYRRVLAVQPGNLLTNERMAFLTAFTGRRWEALDYYFVLIRGGAADFRELALAADVGRPIEQPDFLRRCLARRPGDENVRVAAAAEAFAAGRNEAVPLLRSLVDDFPHRLAVQAMLGERLVDADDPAEFLAWHASLPQAAEQSPDIWFVRGLWSRRRGDLEAASECLLRSVREMPFHRRGFYLLGQVLTAAGDPRATEAVAYSQRLITLTQQIDDVLVSKGRDVEAFRGVAHTLEDLGRTWEAVAWAVAAGQRFPTAQWPSELLTRRLPGLDASRPRIDAARLPPLVPAVGTPRFDRLLASTMSAFAVSGSAKSALEAASPRATGPSDGDDGGLPAFGAVRFTAVDNIPFRYFSAPDPQTPGVRMFEQNGGGVAVLDYDLDAAPDVFLSQGVEWPTGSNVPRPGGEHRDGLFRNRGGVRFDDVSDTLGGEDRGYGQGAAVADFDSDGFPDLIVGNIGANRLLKNLGDGTFADVTDRAGFGGDRWTASMAFCDLNADGHPDIYEVNYLMGERVYEQICEDHGCSPGVYSGAPNRVILSGGDGTFAAADDSAPTAESKGLGVLAMVTTDRRRPDLFVANDQTSNFLLKNRPAENAANLELSEEAILEGLAFNDDGTAMACMGVAADDWDADGRTDLFVTNFLDEANTLYRQDAAGLFVDATRSAGLYAASLDMTGWGTQSLDADLDGRPDLILVNGHVYDTRDQGGVWKMRPQFFRNVGGRFAEADDPAVAGEWFGQQRLGRGLARLDWNLDGRPECVVSNLDGPVSVLRNDTPAAGHFVKLRLHARASARDAIGALMTVCAGGRTLSRQLTAGDGYMASNERTTIFGLADAESVSHVVIDWPSGSQTVLRDVPTDAALTIVEGSATALQDVAGRLRLVDASTAETATARECVRP